MESTGTSAGRPATRIELDNGVSFSINEDSLPLTIGRDSGCDIHISSGHVSRHHCELFLRDGRLFLRDTSSNGTKVDNRVVKQSSVTIDRRTSVMLADEIRLVLTPLDELPPDASREGADPDSQRAGERPEVASAQSQAAERRRGHDRRQRNVVVAFERRSGHGERRSNDQESDPEY